MADQQVLKTYQRINDILLPRTNQTYHKLLNLYKNEEKDFDIMQNQIDDVLKDLKQKMDQSTSNINEKMKKNLRDEDVKKKGQTFINAKTEELKNKNKNIESVISGLKESVGKIKPTILAGLPVEKQRSLMYVFQMLYNVLYTETKPFVWKEFREKALIAQEGEDFQSRLANINIRELSDKHYSSVKKAKEDPEFNKLCENPSFINQLIDLGDWMQYVCIGYDFVREKIAVEKEFEKINRDITKRKIEGKQQEQSLKFWRQTNAQVEEFTNNLNEIQSRLKGIQLGIGKSVPTLQANIKKTEDKINQINKQS